MADVLIMHPDYVHHNPTHPAAYASGMVVDVFPDGQLGPGTQQHPRFIIIRIPGASKEEVKDLIEEYRDLVTDDLIMRRRQKVNWATVPNNTMRQIERDREFTLTAAQLRQYMERLD